MTSHRALCVEMYGIESTFLKIFELKIQKAIEEVKSLQLELDKEDVINDPVYFLARLQSTIVLVEEQYRYISYYKHCHATGNMEKIYHKATELYTEWSLQFANNIVLYDYYLRLTQILELPYLEKKVVEILISQAQLQGISLDEGQAKEFKSNEMIIINLELQFYDTLVNAQQLELAGTKVCDISYVLERLDDPTKRRSIYLAYQEHLNTLGNVTRLEQIRLHRDANAKLLGYESFGQMQLRDTYPTDINHIQDTLQSVEDILSPQVEEIIHTLGLVYPWDISYLIHQNKSLLPLFKLDRVLQGINHILETWFNIKLTLPPKPNWSSEVECIVHLPNKKKCFIFLDLFKRVGKQGGAACFGLNEHSAAIVCRFHYTPDDMDINDVLTLLHEVGHAIHHILAQQSKAPLLDSLDHVLPSLVEMPSQLFELFLWTLEFQREAGCTSDECKAIQDYKIMPRVFDLYVTTKLAQVDLLIANTTILAEVCSDQAFALVHSALSRKSNYLNTFEHLVDSNYSGRYWTYIWGDLLAEVNFVKMLEKGNAQDITSTLVRGGEVGCSDAALSLKDWIKIRYIPC